MKLRSGFKVKSVLACAGLVLALSSVMTPAQTTKSVQPDAYDRNNRAPDPRFKADILGVVAHPDEEVMVGAYLAREIYDHHKRVAVVFQNPCLLYTSDAADDLLC